MSKLPLLTNWENTGHSLHQAAELLGAIRRLLLEHQPNWLELSLQIHPEGLSTGRLSVGELVLDFTQAALVYKPTLGEATWLSLIGHSQQSLLEALLGTLAAYGHRLVEKTAEFPTTTAALQHAIHTKRNKRLNFAETPLMVDQQLAADYAQVLYRIFTAMVRFRTGLEGTMTPLVVWPEHFDLSMLWFATSEANEHAAPHMNFGFAPYSPGFERPYLYAYAYPYPPDFIPMPLPCMTYWNTTPWKGVVLSYDELTKTAEPEAAIEAAFEQIYQALLPALH